MERNIWIDGMMGVIVGDALGCPVQFMAREEIVDRPEALLTAVNLGDDADTVGAIAGGLAALYYGYGGIPEEWLSVIKRREWIEDLSRKAAVTIR